MHHRDSICADHLPKRRANSIKKPGFFSGSVNCAGARVIVEFSNEMREHFGIRFRAKARVAVANEVIFERLVIFDHPIMDQRQFAAGVEVRMRVLIVHLAVRGPARVADPERT